MFGVYSRPMKLMKSIVSLNAGGTWTRTPSRINGLDNTGSTYAIRSGVVLASNISQNLDFTLTYFGTYNISRNTLTNDNTGDYYSSSAGLRLNAVVSHGVVMREELNHNLQSGVPSAYGQDVMLWNTTLGKKFLKDDRGELRVTLTDVFEQSRSVSRSVTESCRTRGTTRAVVRRSSPTPSAEPGARSSAERTCCVRRASSRRSSNLLGVDSQHPVPARLDVGGARVPLASFRAPQNGGELGLLLQRGQPRIARHEVEARESTVH